MNLVKCPRCGEEYSPSYRTCPFCEEEERPRKLRNRNRSGHRVTEKKKTHSGKGALITILILVLALLTWYLFGEQLLERFAQPDEQEPPVEDTTPDGNETDDPFYDPVTGETGDPNAVEPPVIDEPPVVDEQPVIDQPVEPTVDPSQLAIKTNVSGTLPQGADGRYDCTVKLSESIRLIVTGTDASVTWATENAGIATISADGLITPVSAGITTATATVGGTTLSCILRIR
ncbi:MAG: Ig-like domain-containing protein [Oscillospiraceae bacterium]|nr:Ig-like domain-containing protein [Oscillospiraceae bacterium]